MGSKYGSGSLFVDNTAKRRISKRVLQENKAHQVFQKNEYILTPDMHIRVVWVILVRVGLWISLFSRGELFWLLLLRYQAIIYLFKVNNRSDKKIYKTCSKLTIKTLEWSHGYRFGVFYCLLWTYFTPFSSVSYIAFEYVFVCWVTSVVSTLISVAASMNRYG